MTPDISVIIPAYNVAPYLASALDSALSQVGVEIEVVVVDDGSTDTTPEVIARYAGDPRVRVISQGNTGPSVSRNAGIAQARGRYIGFLDGDDLWDPGKALAHVRIMDANPGLDVTYSWWRIIDEHGNHTNRANTQPRSALPAGMGFEGLLVENYTGTASTLVCRAEAVRAVGGLDAALRSNVDLDLLLMLTLLRPDNMELVPWILTSYRIHATQITSDWKRMHENWNRVFDKMKAIAPDRTAAVETLARGRVSRYFAYIAYVRGDHAAARSLIARAWRLAPRSMAADARCRLVTLAILATYLPSGIHSTLAGAAGRLRTREVAR